MAGFIDLLNENEPVELIAVSVDPPATSRELAAKLSPDRDLPYQLLSDTGGKVIRTYDLVDPAYEGQARYGIPRPAVYVLTPGRKAVWSRVETNYRERPSNAEVRAAIDRALSLLRPMVKKK